VIDQLPLSEHIRFPEGFRPLREEDINQPFSCREPRMDRYTLEDYFKWNNDPNSLVIMREIEGKVAGVIYLTVHPRYIMLEMLARNKLLDYPGVGGDLVRVVERVVAPQLCITEIRMEALQHVISYYDNKLGYEEYGEPYQDSEWGLLTPKRKLLPYLP
jgi:hypothetical protein